VLESQALEFAIAGFEDVVAHAAAALL
jgi:hypothetical protein